MAGSRAPIAVRKATEGDRGALEQLLREAFRDDPFVLWLIGPGRGQDKRLARYVALSLDLTLPHGEVYIEAGGRGAALWAPPGTWEPDLGKTLRILPRLLGIIGVTRFARIDRTLADIDRARPRPPWWLLVLIGVQPAARRRGVGAALLRPILDRCDREEIPAALETSNTVNLDWYVGQGFDVHRQVELDAQTTCWTMRRLPRRPPRRTPR